MIRTANPRAFKKYHSDMSRIQIHPKLQLSAIKGMPDFEITYVGPGPINSLYILDRPKIWGVRI